ncbi:MAG: AarF/UbiB family protein [Chloroflexota bacterium]
MSAFLPRPWFAQGHLLRRSREIAWILTRHGLGWLAVQVGLGNFIPFERGWFGHPARATPYTQAEHLRMALEELGATFIKLGQALSTRSDLVSPEYVTQLAKLQDAAPPVPFEQICQVIWAELGQSPENIFAAFAAQPFASASIGQAHTATLKEGQPVIVKVQRPGMAAQVEQDLAILAGMAGRPSSGQLFRPSRRRHCPDRLWYGWPSRRPAAGRAAAGGPGCGPAGYQAAGRRIL